MLSCCFFFFFFFSSIVYNFISYYFVYSSSRYIYSYHMRVQLFDRIRSAYGTSHYTQIELEKSIHILCTFRFIKSERRWWIKNNNTFTYTQWRLWQFYKKNQGNSCSCMFIILKSRASIRFFSIFFFHLFVLLIYNKTGIAWADYLCGRFFFFYPIR